MKTLMPRDTLMYGKRKLKDIQPVADCAGSDTMTTQREPVTANINKGLRWVDTHTKALTDRCK
jgi:hypothetical protein